MSEVTGQQWYQRYLSTAHWRQFRKVMLKQVGCQCQRCRSEDDLQVHHRLLPTMM